jgi:hypothetical protein
VFAGKNIEAEPCGRRNPITLLVRNDLEQLGRAVAPLRPELGQVTRIAFDSILR